MSSTTVNGSADQTHVGEDAGLTGSPSALPADGVEGEIVDQGEGSEPETHVEADGLPPGVTEVVPKGEPAAVADPRVAELERQLAERDSILSDLAQRMEVDPVLREALSSRGAPQKQDASDYATDVMRVLRDPESGLKPEAADVLERAFTPVLKRLQELERDVKPRLDDLSRTVGSAQFERSLIDSGVSVQTLKDPGFRKFVAAKRADPSFARLEATDQRFAGEVLANAWQASKSRQASWKDDRARLEAAKSQRNGNPPPRGASQATRVFDVPMGPDQYRTALQIRDKYPNATIRYVKPK